MELSQKQFEEEIKQHFLFCSRNLQYLPDCFKKWKDSLSDYRNNWDFLRDRQILNGVAEQEMALDYLWSIDEWLGPGLVFGFFHKLLFIHGLGAIYEAILTDLWKYELKKGGRATKFISTVAEKFESESFDTLISTSKKTDLLDDYWNKYLHELKQIRNLTHLPKQQRNRKRLVRGTFFQKSLTELKSDLIGFRDFIKKKY